MSGERLNINSEDGESGGGDNPWQEAMRDVPTFGGAERQESKEADAEFISERFVAEKMLDISSEKQDELIAYLNQINSGEGLTYDADAAYEKYLEENGIIDSTEAMAGWRESLSSELDGYARRDECIIRGMEELDRPVNAGKSLEEIFANLAEQQQGQVNFLVQSGAWSNKLNDKQRQDRLDRRDEYQNLADWAPWVRKSLELDTPDDYSGSEETAANGIDIDGMIDDLQAELQKRQKAIEFLEAKDQRDYGDQTLDAKVHLLEKQRDLHVLKMIQKANFEQSEDGMVLPEIAAATIEKYLSDRQAIFDRLTKQREQYIKGSKEYRDITEKRGRWYKEMEAAGRVAKQLGLELRNDSDDEGELAMENESWSGAQTEAQPTKSSTSAEGGQPTEHDAQEKIEVASEQSRTNSEAEVRAVCEVIEAVRPDVEQLFAMSRGSFSMEQATAYLLTSNREMADLSAQYMNMLQNGQNIGELEAFAAGYDEKIMRSFGYSTNAINSIRQKAQTLPISFKGPALRYCQEIENALAQVVSIVEKKDEKIHSHDTPMEKQRIDEKELEGVVEEEMGM